MEDIFTSMYCRLRGGSLSLNKGCAPNASHSLILLLLGFSRARVSPSVLFLLFLVIYLTTMMGNVTLVLLISQDPRLHSPMYYLLHGLSVIDMGLSTVTLPQLLAHLVTHDPAIPAARCLAQFFFFYAFGVTDTLVISVMALDHYVAICDPLHYHLVMNRTLYFQPPSQNSWDQDMVAAVTYTAITPLAHPFVYSIHNKGVKSALHRLLRGGRVGS
ncbi:LOW QUALITY PROTEIN: olfactory receptor 1B1 [Balaenoptera musculus]|uniref:LOW QUALITY PROTEIN: olfactory receptor 1B1 n=1 Tax=Balaenoptera musculus TaxID=9771 RepID=A0A8B8XR80_BALMU|nr:LOW QUALITY PROTEIN: olfactory receptor 1B1 [Balaenoptera musculus]